MFEGKSLYEIVQQSVLLLIPQDYLLMTDEQKIMVARNILNIIQHTYTFRYKLKHKALEEIDKIINDTIDNYKLVDTKYLELLKNMLIILNEPNPSIQ